MRKALLAFAVLALCLSSNSNSQPLPASAGPDQAELRSPEAQQQDREHRRALAEWIVSDREQRSGRQFDAAYRKQRVEALLRETAEQLASRREAPGIASMNVGDPRSDLVFTPVNPCRVIDTRTGGGPIVPGTDRNFRVTGADFTAQGGSAGDCGIPFGPASSVMINFVAVNPAGGGNLKGAAYPNAMPATGSILNYQALTPNLNIANGLAFPICNPDWIVCHSEITLSANGSATDVVADVLGYFSRFPKEQVQSLVAMGWYVPLFGVITPVAGVCTNVTSVTIVPWMSRGEVLLRGEGRVRIAHTNLTRDDATFFISNSPSGCSTSTFGGDAYGVVSVPAAAPTSADYDYTVPVTSRDYEVMGQRTYYLNVVTNAGSNDAIRNGVITAEFHPW